MKLLCCCVLHICCTFLCCSLCVCVCIACSAVSVHYGKKKKEKKIEKNVAHLSFVFFVCWGCRRQQCFQWVAAPFTTCAEQQTGTSSCRSRPSRRLRQLRVAVTLAPSWEAQASSVVPHREQQLELLPGPARLPGTQRVPRRSQQAVLRTPSLVVRRSQQAGRRSQQAERRSPRAGRHIPRVVRRIPLPAGRRIPLPAARRTRQGAQSREGEEHRRRRRRSRGPGTCPEQGLELAACLSVSCRFCRGRLGGNRRRFRRRFRWHRQRRHPHHRRRHRRRRNRRRTASWAPCCRRGRRRGRRHGPTAPSCRLRGCTRRRTPGRWRRGWWTPMKWTAA